MKRIVPICICSAMLAGCVEILHDSKINELKPLDVTLKEFEGTFQERAVYYTPPTMTGLMGDDTLGGALRELEFRSNARVEITPSEDIVVTPEHDFFGGQPLRYVKEKDFDFIDHCIVFRGRSHAGSDDSPVIGAYTWSMKWMLNDSRQLVVIKSSKGGGLVTVIPTVVAGSTLSIFSRVKKEANQ